MVQNNQIIPFSGKKITEIDPLVCCGQKYSRSAHRVVHTFKQHRLPWTNYTAARGICNTKLKSWISLKRPS